MKSLILCLLLAGCVTSREYVVETIETDGPLIATRVKDGRPVILKNETIDWATAREVDSGHKRVTAKALNKRLIAGSVLTWVGTAISIAGTAMLVATWNNHNDLYTTGWVLAPSAEPIMIAGTVLWILALKHPPMEMPMEGPR
jgi:hypothetical protein